MNKPTIKLTTNVDKNQWTKELAILSDKMGKLWLMSTVISEVSEMVLKTPNNPITIECSVDYRFKIITECMEIATQFNISPLEINTIIPTIDKVLCEICGEIYALAHETGTK